MDCEALLRGLGTVKKGISTLDVNKGNLSGQMEGQGEPRSRLTLDVTCIE